MKPADLRAEAFELEDGGGLHAVPEPVVKRWLAQEVGLPVPASVTIGASNHDPAVWSALREPLVLKAFGPGLVHKSEVGGVALGLAAADVGSAIERMRHELSGHRVTPAGFLVEEQLPADCGGIELIVGVVRHPSAGPLVLLGHGGMLAELLEPARDAATADQRARRPGHGRRAGGAATAGRRTRD